MQLSPARAGRGVQKPLCRCLSDRRGRASKQSAPSPIPPSPPDYPFDITTSRDHVSIQPRRPYQPYRALSTAPRAILRGGLTSAVTPGPVWSSSSCFVTAAVVPTSSDEDLLRTRLLQLTVKLRRDLVWHTSNRAAWRTGLAAQGSTMDPREQSTRCKVSSQHRASGTWASTTARLQIQDNMLIYLRAQASCASSKSNGTTTSAPETPGTSNAQR